MKKVILSQNTLESKILTLPFGDDFIQNHPNLCIEIGCGNGHFINDMAFHNPTKTFIACDVKKDRVYKTLKRLEKNELNNVFAYIGKGEDLLNALPSESLLTFYMNFPDPWPKKRHHKRRFFYPMEILSVLSEKLKKDGEIYFASDYKEYFFFVLEERLKAFPLLYTELPNGYVHNLPGYFETLYEKKWREENRELYYTVFKKR